MGLPIQKAPKHKCELSGGREVEFRPFLVKEQKFLLLAKESEDNMEILGAVKGLINAVTEGKVDSDTLPIFDLEYLFLQVRAKSVGESVKLTLQCQETGCTGHGETEVDLTEVKVKYPDESPNPEIALSDTLGVTLRYPTTKQLAIIDSKETADRIIGLLKYGIESIYDDETVYITDEIESEELIEFIESLTINQMEKLNDFFETIPGIEEHVDFECKQCGSKSTSVLRGLADFF